MKLISGSQTLVLHEESIDLVLRSLRIASVSHKPTNAVYNQLYSFLSKPSKDIQFDEDCERCDNCGKRSDYIYKGKALCKDCYKRV